jgi:hypothetical protein
MTPKRKIEWGIIIVIAGLIALYTIPWWYKPGWGI